MQTFIQKYQDLVIGSLSGFDRLVFRGTLRCLAHVRGMESFLYCAGVLLKDFGTFMERLTTHVRKASKAAATVAGRPILHLDSPRIRKEDRAREIAARDGIKEGLICVLTCVEPGYSFDIHRNAELQKLQLVARPRPFLNIYHYSIHPRFGFMHVRLGTWAPFQVQVCLNGREWLARSLERRRIPFVRRDNTFSRVEDVRYAQHLLNAQLRLPWPEHLNEVMLSAHPAHPEIFGDLPVEYYWSVYQSEWATDVMFRDAESLARIYPRLVNFGITQFGSQDVMRFLGRLTETQKNLPAQFKGEVISDLRTRPEGIRIKHRVNGNSVKLYDKQGSILRAETTINQPSEFKVYRTAEGDPSGTPRWRPMRRGVADLHRRAEISQAANTRYLAALTPADTSLTAGDLVGPVCRPTLYSGKRVRPLQPWAEDDAALLAAVARGEFVVDGFRNRDIRAVLYPNAKEDEVRRLSSRVGRMLRILRAHGLISRVPKTHRYMLGLRGRAIVTAILASRRASSEKLLEIAA